MVKTTKKAVVVLAFSLIGFIQAAPNNLTLESDVIPDVEERIDALLGEHQVANHLQALQTKVAGLPAAEAGELLEDVQNVRAEFVKFEDQCRKRTKDYVEITYEYNLTYHKVIEQLVLKHKRLNATLEDLAKSEAALSAANKINAELERKLHEALQELNARKSESVDSGASAMEAVANLTEQLAQRDKQVVQYQMEKELIQKDFQLCKQQNNHTSRGSDVEESISRLTIENEDLKRQLRECNETAAQATSQLAIVNGNNYELDKSAHAMSNSLSHAMRILRKHEGKLAALREENKYCLQKSENLTATLNQTSQELAECLYGKQNGTCSSSELDKELSEVVKRLMKENDELSDQLETAKQNEQNQAEVMGAMQAELAQSRDDITRLTSDKAEMEDAVNSINLSYKELKVHCDDEKQSAEEKITSLEAEKQQCMENSANLTTTLNQTSLQLEDCLKACNSYKQSIKLLIQQNTELNDKLSNANETILEHENQCKAKEDAAKENITSLEAEKQQCLENSANLTKALNETTLQLEKSSVCNSTQVDEKGYKQSIRLLIQQNTELNDKLWNATETILEHEKQCKAKEDAAKENITSLEAEKQQCLENSANLTKALNQTSQELEHYQQANQTSGCNNTASADQDLIEALIQLEKDAMLWTAKLNETAQMFPNLTNAESIKELQNILVALAHEKKELDEFLKDVVERAKEMLIKLSKELDNEGTKNAQLEQELLSKSQQVDALIREHEKNCTKLGEKGLGRNIELLMEQNEILDAKLKDALNALNAVAQAHVNKTQVTALMDVVSKLSGDNDALRRKLDEALEEIAALRKSLHGYAGSSESSDNITKAIEKLTNIEEALGLLPDSTPAERPLPQSCAEAMEQAAMDSGKDAVSGVYQLFLPESGLKPFYVYCLKDPGCGSAWTVIQHRSDNSTDFNREWNEYKQGFGNLRNEFFIGLDKLNALTQVQLQELRVEMVDFDGQTRYATYDNFAIGDASEQYALNILGQYEGNAGDSLRRQQGQKFSTADKDNDASDENCAETYSGAWWYEACQDSNLNGLYLPGNLSKDQYGQGIVWSDWHGQYYSLKSVYMAIRPKV